MKKVEQINSDGKVFLERDNIFGKKEIEKIISKYFVAKEENGYFVFERNKEKYFLFIKNVTYLGHPHPIHKKRIQVSKKWSDLLTNKNSFLLGIYNCKDNIVFVLFDKKTRGKNSSAHIHTIDIVKAVESGIFQKVDKMGNNLVVFREDKIKEVFDSIIKKEKIKNVEEIELFNVFSDNIDKKWNGIKSYSEMIDRKFSQALQPEWPGFYLEFKFEDFLNKKLKYKKICKYKRNKNVGSLDFDLEFVKNNFLGDLKTHDVNSRAVLGNDKISVHKVINDYERLWYVVFELTSEKDKNFDCKVSRFWNQKLRELRNKNKEDISYCNKMKYNIVLNNLYILEINKFNEKYLSDMKQGRNSDGNLRNLKIMINKKDIDNFVIYRKNLYSQ
ncbi:hypothetical protein A3I18_00165 [Candidatus Campbellbacteria bacterium RIFCSPLOWO2_02_FULL_35_11]|uniref:Methylase-associated X1 domain-containing protein n=2 Tax=Candidatus Campbelliibacteriota TaxID=1752727 RepID=A0A1F5ENL7_9BACT|nr:MAG: hypothetical protein A3E89_02950 [Candidatus Campbellbacteria bacterium RIFCSPHIGHO2_12_FULL_35_10]OGD70053.1 MAG: hypothetical protein A3I18_00165 [Candidatus Campbellbacteria bacterium RIFCSPLOWO2_02_FULL_35_11]OGH65415.1 MAG: hypothetical protein A3B83_01040 [Candidatus Magasanikbacteria bacterium RIFCSPHIGHO2_02_FULL_33_17]